MFASSRPWSSPHLLQVRQGIDTFDCVHPTRLGRHGGALVKASFWEIEQRLDDEREAQAQREGAVDTVQDDSWKIEGRKGAGGGGGNGGSTAATTTSSSSSSNGSARRRRSRRLTPREHVNLLKGRFGDDHRPIDENCGCPTCKRG